MTHPLQVLSVLNAVISRFSRLLTVVGAPHNVSAKNVRWGRGEHQQEASTCGDDTFCTIVRSLSKQDIAPWS